jgi:NurA-like 5'-3' nuclease
MLTITQFKKIFEKENIEDDEIMYLDLDNLTEKYGLTYNVIIGDYIKFKVKIKDSSEASKINKMLNKDIIIIKATDMLDKEMTGIYKKENDTDVKYIIKTDHIYLFAKLKFVEFIK